MSLIGSMLLFMPANYLMLLAENVHLPDIR